MTRVRSAVVAGIAASLVMLVTAAPAHAAGRPPVLDRFVARFNPQSTTTFYIAVASDPDGGKLTYRWTLRAECGVLTDPRATGASNGYQFGPPAKAGGCSTQEQREARITLRIVDSEGCTTTYTQAARNETEHLKPPTQSGPCPPDRAAGGSGTGSSRGFPSGIVILVLLLAGALAGLAGLRRLRPADEGAREEWEEPIAPRPAPAARDAAPAGAGAPPVPSARTFEPDAFAAPAEPAVPERKRRSPAPAASGLAAYARAEPESLFDADEDAAIASILGVDDARELFAEPGLPAPVALDAAPVGLPEAGEPCREGEVRREGNDLVAHDTVLAGMVRATLLGGESVEIIPGGHREIVRFGSALDDHGALEVEVVVPVRLVTVVSTRREVCRGGRWVLDVQSVTHDGPERVERLRAIATSVEDLERFAEQIVARRLRTLTDARRRLESALATMRESRAQS